MVSRLAGAATTWLENSCINSDEKVDQSTGQDVSVYGFVGGWYPWMLTANRIIPILSSIDYGMNNESAFRVAVVRQGHLATRVHAAQNDKRFVRKNR